MLHCIIASSKYCIIGDVLCDLVPFVQFKNVKNTNGGVLFSVKLQAFSLQLY